MNVLLVTPDQEIRDIFGRGLPLGWVLDMANDAEGAFGILDEKKADLIIADMDLSGMSGKDFLQALQERMEWPPAAVLVTQSEPDEATHEAAVGLKVQELLCRPVDEEAVQRIFEPYRPDDGPPRMSLLEFLIAGYRDLSTRQLDLVAEGYRISLIFGMGYLWAVLHPQFNERYREALAGAGFELPDRVENDLLDQAAVEERLGPSPELSALKHRAVLSILASIPLHLTFRGRIAEVVIPDGLVPLDPPTFVVRLVEHVPESALAVLRTPGLRVGPSQGTIPPDLPLQPVQGFILSLCDGMVPVEHLVRMGTVPEPQVLSNVYLLLLIGLLRSEPSGGNPFRLAGLQREMEQETQRIYRQKSALRSFAADFQTPGRSPYDVLGISPTTADGRQAMEAYQVALDRLSPQKLHPVVYKEHLQDIMFIKAKLGEAFLLLQSSLLKDKALARDGQAGGAGQSPGGGEKDPKAQQEAQKKEAQKMVDMARQLLEQEKPFEAGQCLKLAILYDPDMVVAHHLMGKVYMQHNDSKAIHMAERKFLDALQLAPGDIEIHMDLTQLYLSQGMLERGRACFAKAQRLDPKNPRILELRDALKAAEKKGG